MFTLSSNRLSIVPATRNDLSLILALIKELAVYERLAHEVIATEMDCLSYDSRAARSAGVTV
jgi:hypothetical protein